MIYVDKSIIRKRYPQSRVCACKGQCGSMRKSIHLIGRSPLKKETPMKECLHAGDNQGSLVHRVNVFIIYYIFNSRGHGGYCAAAPNACTPIIMTSLALSGQPHYISQILSSWCYTINISSTMTLTYIGKMMSPCATTFFSWRCHHLLPYHH